jgi:hypothetical protein
MKGPTSRWRTALRALRLAVFFAVLVGMLSTPADPAGSTKLDNFAKCVATKSTFYGSFWCPHCEDQKKLFGDSFKYIHYVECAVPRSRQISFECMAARIRVTPTWIFSDGERREGVQSLQQLGDKTGCRLP